MPRNRIEITHEIRSELTEAMKRTGLGGSALMRGKRGQYADGLTGSMIDKWRTGTIRSAKPDHLEWVLGAYRDWSPALPSKIRKIIITDERHELLMREVKRTKLGAVAILRHAPKPLPNGLNHQKVQRWISGQTETALQDHWEHVMRLYAEVSC